MFNRNSDITAYHAPIRCNCTCISFVGIFIN